MATASARFLLPASTTRSAAHEGSSIAVLQSRAPDAAAYRWNASLCVDPGSPRPTPITDALDIEFTLEAFQTLLPKTMQAFAHPDGLLVIQRSAHRLYCTSIRIHTTEEDASLRLSIAPMISLVAAQSAADFDTRPVLDALSSVLPIVHDPEAKVWRIASAELFAHFIDAGWNLPLPRGPGTYRLRSQLHSLLPPSHDFSKEPWADEDTTPPDDGTSGDTRCTLVWNAAEKLSNTSRPIATAPISPRIERALEEYAAGLPATSSILSATTFGDHEGGHIAMRVASIAAEQNDIHTLQTLRITQQRLHDRGQTRLAVLSALFSAHAMLRSPDIAASLLEPLASQLSHELSWEPTAEWFKAQCSEWFATLNHHDPKWTESISAPKPEEPLQALKALKSGTRTTRKSVPEPRHSAPADASFAEAYDAFQNDDDDLAWQRTAAALEAGQPIQEDAIASMVLRLIARYADQASSTAALEAIVRDVSSELHYVRAVQLLADHYDALGALERTSELLQTALKRFPNSILLRVSFAQFLSRIGHSSAERAWTYVLEHESLEPWEARLYTQEQSAARAWQQQRQAGRTRPSSIKPRQAPHAKSESDLFRHNAIDALEMLHPPAPNAPASNVEELGFIERALQQQPSTNERASMLARRAVLFMRMNEIERAAQSWTGALILMPETASVLGGVAATRTLQDTERGSDKARRQFRDAAAQYHSDNVDHVQAIKRLVELLG